MEPIYESFPPQIKIMKLHPDAVLPERATALDAGYDVVAIDDGVIGDDGTYIEYRTGFAIEVPEGYHTELFPRSSITKLDLILANSIGLVDNGYRGELLFRFKCVQPVFRHAPGSNPRPNGPKVYKKGDKIGQIVLRKTYRLGVVETHELSATTRGTGGFGSTDKK